MGARAATLLAACLFCLFPAFSHAENEPRQETPHANSPQHLSLEELLDLEMEVVSSSRHPEPATLAAGAVMVLDAEAIMRGGGTTLPDVLRRIPSLQVSKEGVDTWSVRLRGFSGLRNSTLLVMVDGRPVTSPSLAGVLWSGQIIPVETIARIEVIRGPCTSLWGLDSFNGVVNVITKRAEDGQQEMSVTTAGTTGLGQYVHGGGVIETKGEDSGSTSGGEAGHWRAFSGVSYADGGEFDGARKGSRYWTQYGSGFRSDYTTSATDELSIQGGVYTSSIARPQPTPTGEGRAWSRTYNGHMQLTWDRATGLDTGLHARTSYTRARETIADLEGVANVADAELQHSFMVGTSQRVVMGFGGRYIWDEYVNGDKVQFDPMDTARGEWNAFAQDRIALTPDGLDLILGIKLDKAGSHLEPQPTVRLLYDEGDNVFWAAVSRAVRSADRHGRSMDLQFDHRGTTYDVTEGDNLNGEKLTAWEAGWRRSGKTLSMDLALFVNRYEDMIGFEIDNTAKQIILSNDLSGTTMGAEYSISWLPAPNFMLVPSLSYLHHSWQYEWRNPQNGTGVPEGDFIEPRLQAYYDPADDISLNAVVYYFPDQPMYIDPPVNMDAGIIWHAHEDLRFDLSGENLLGSRKTASGQRQDPGASLRMTWSF